MPPRKINNLRVAGGDARGVRLTGPSIPGVRPTTERVRAAVFNILTAAQVVDRRVLDLFAGTGSLGIEALSRGAAGAVFVERNRRQSQDLQANVARAGYADLAQVHCADAARWLRQQAAASDDQPGFDSSRFELALMDPPYRMGDPTPTLQTLWDSGALAPGATVVIGHSSRIELADDIGGLRRYDQRRYGDNAIAFYR